MSISLYFIVKNCDAPENELGKVVPASRAESIKTELQHTGGVKRSTDGEGSTTDKIRRGAYEEITPKNKAKIAKYAAENGIAAALCHFNKQ